MNGVALRRRAPRYFSGGVSLKQLEHVMSRFRSFVVGASLLTSLAAGAAFAEGTGAPPQLGVRDVDFIRAHYHRLENSARQGLPNGLARKAELPKGLAKRVARSADPPDCAVRRSTTTSSCS